MGKHQNGVSLQRIELRDFGSHTLGCIVGYVECWFCVCGPLLFADDMHAIVCSLAIHGLTALFSVLKFLFVLLLFPLCL